MTDTIRKFLDASTAHLSPAARAWLSESATLNHAVSYHGHGNGAAVSTLGATLNGWFMHAPELPGDGGADCGIPEDLHPLIKHAHANDCHYILFDADGPIIEGLPEYEWENDDN